MNYIREYYNAIQRGEITVSRKVERVYRFLISQMDAPTCQYVFDERRAEHAIYFIEHFCKHSKGKQGGKPLIHYDYLYIE